MSGIEGRISCVCVHRYHVTTKIGGQLPPGWPFISMAVTRACSCCYNTVLVHRTFFLENACQYCPFKSYHTEQKKIVGHNAFHLILYDHWPIFHRSFVFFLFSPFIFLFSFFSFVLIFYTHSLASAQPFYWSFPLYKNRGGQFTTHIRLRKLGIRVCEILKKKSSISPLVKSI